MSDVQKKIQELRSKWAEVYETAQDNPSLWEQNFPDLTPDEVDDIVSTIVKVFNRRRAPSGYSAGYGLAKSVVLSVLPRAEEQLNQLVALQFNHIRPFINQLNTLLGATLTIFITTSTDSLEQEVIAESSNLIEAVERAKKAIGDLDEEGKELEQRRQELSQREGRLDDLDNRTETLQTKVTALDEIQGEIEEHKTQAQASLEEIQTVLAGLKQREKELTKIASDADGANSTLESLTEEAEKIHEQINGLLPGAASAGLAASFEARAAKLVRPKYVWMTIFLGSIVAMLAVVYFTPKEGEWWEYSLRRVPFIAPLVWLGWFSAVQYGNTVRLEEDYRFKSSTSKAFVGYRDHMEHLSDVDTDAKVNALTLLSTRTVEILAREPGRLLGHPAKEASPSSGAMSVAKSKEED